MLRQCAKTATTILHAASINFAMPAMLGRLVAQLKMPRLDAYVERNRPFSCIGQDGLASTRPSGGLIEQGCLLA